MNACTIGVVVSWGGSVGGSSVDSKEEFVNIKRILKNREKILLIWRTSFSINHSTVRFKVAACRVRLPSPPSNALFVVYLMVAFFLFLLLSPLLPR